MRIVRGLTAAAVLTIGLTGAARADVIVTDVEMRVNPADIVNLVTPVPVEAYAGQVALTTSAGPINAWCVDINHDVDLGGGQNLDYALIQRLSTDYNGYSLSQPQINEMSWMIATGSEVMDHGGSADQSAAIQLAIWALEYSGLTFSASGSVTSLEATYFADALAQANNTSFDSQIWQLSGTQGQQSFAYFVPVPEPASIGLFGTALVAAAGVWRRRRKPKA